MIWYLMTVQFTCFKSTVLLQRFPTLEIYTLNLYPSNFCKIESELSYLLEEIHHLRHLTIFSQQCPYVTLAIVLCSTVPPLRAVLQAMFYCQTLVSTCCTYAFWLLTISCHQMSMGQSSVSYAYSTQFNLILGCSYSILF